MKKMALAAALAVSFSGGVFAVAEKEVEKVVQQQVLAHQQQQRVQQQQ